MSFVAALALVPLTIPFEGSFGDKMTFLMTLSGMTKDVVEDRLGVGEEGPVVRGQGPHYLYRAPNGDALIVDVFERPEAAVTLVESTFVFADREDAPLLGEFLRETNGEVEEWFVVPGFSTIPSIVVREMTRGRRIESQEIGMARWIVSETQPIDVVKVRVADQSYYLTLTDVGATPNSGTVASLSRLPRVANVEQVPHNPVANRLYLIDADRRPRFSRESWRALWDQVWQKIPERDRPS